MQNNYSNRQGQMQDKENDFVRSAVKQGEEKVKDMASDAQQQLQEGQKQVSQVIGTLDKQIRDNPWPIIAGVAVGAFLLGSLINKSNK